MNPWCDPGRAKLDRDGRRDETLSRRQFLLLGTSLVEVENSVLAIFPVLAKVIDSRPGEAGGRKKVH